MLQGTFGHYNKQQTLTQPSYPDSTQQNLRCLPYIEYSKVSEEDVRCELDILKAEDVRMFKVRTAETVIVRKPWCRVSIMLTISATDRELTAPGSEMAEVAGRTAAWKLTCLYLPPDGGLL